MSLGDTTLGGSARAYPSTCWSEILAVQDPGDPARRERLGELLRAYWKPVYAGIRLGWRKTNEDAKDLTQAFFAHLLQNHALARVRPEGGTFRAFLKRALRNFLIDADRAARVRRSAEAVVGLDDAGDGLDRWSPPAPGDSPEKVFDREWLACLLEASTAALERELAAEGKEMYARVFRLYLLEPVAGASSTIHSASGDVALPTYGAVAAKLGLRESDVRNYLSYGRGRAREILKAEIRRYVDSDIDVEEELLSLLRG